MKLDEAQQTKVAEWIAQGLKLSEIQDRLISELHVTMTYMEVRMLVDDLKLTPKDPEPVKPIESRSPLAGPGAALPKPAPPAGVPGKIALSVDQLTQPGAVVSGKVTFSDGNTAAWQIDQAGQLGLIAPQPGYRPPASDVQPFQMALEAELIKLGL
ncbi:MAG: hypothetical protein NT031_05030 [Planctomycetota bacterium]|nr:hypothetical protein [Planctomycetota bacterium]